MERANFDVRQTRIMGDGKFTITQNPGPGLNIQHIAVFSHFHFSSGEFMMMLVGWWLGRDLIP